MRHMVGDGGGLGEAALPECPTRPPLVGRARRARRMPPMTFANMGGAEYAILSTNMKVPLAPLALLAAILSSFAAHAVTESVTFDDALTNRTDETKWEYKDVARTKEGEYHFRKEGATIESME